MPKSKTRGGAKAHKKRVQKRTQMIKDQKAKAEREFMEMIQRAQQEAQEAQEKEAQEQEIENVVGVEELGDIGDGLEL